MNYRYKEDETLKKLTKYINSTYTAHYSQNTFQATEFIIDLDHGEGFCIGNIIKYAQRYGRKNGRNERDLMKLIHYAIILMSIEPKQQPSEKSEPKQSEQSTAQF
jgi:hypothetical protein